MHILEPFSHERGDGWNYAKLVKASVFGSGHLSGYRESVYTLFERYRRLFVLFGPLYYVANPDSRGGLKLRNQLRDGCFIHCSVS